MAYSSRLRYFTIKAQNWSPWSRSPKNALIWGSFRNQWWWKLLEFILFEVIVWFKILFMERYWRFPLAERRVVKENHEGYLSETYDTESRPVF